MSCSVFPNFNQIIICFGRVPEFFAGAAHVHSVFESENTQSAMHTSPTSQRLFTICIFAKLVTIAINAEPKKNTPRLGLPPSSKRDGPRKNAQHESIFVTRDELH